MATGIYKGKVELTAKQVKDEIKRLRGWTEEQYNRARKQAQKQIQSYDIFAERAGEARFGKTPTQLLYSETKAMTRYGASYAPSAKIEQIRGMAKTSSKKRGEKATARATRVIQSAVDRRFAGLIAKNEGAREIADAIKDPLKREKALSEYANAIHANIDGSKGTAVPTETFGSDLAMDELVNELIYEYGDEDMEEVSADELPF